MDRECVLILPRVCEVLAASGSSLPDDTSLEKLLDWFTTITQTGPSILSFTLKLAGLIGASEDGFKVLEVRLKKFNPYPRNPVPYPSIAISTLQGCSVLGLVFDPRHWQEAGLWEDPCLQIGWIQGLKTILQHSKALRFFVQAGNSSCRTLDFLFLTLLNKTVLQGQGGVPLFCAGLIEPLLHLQTDSSLFVASAANQMLAHVLLLCESLSSVGCNGTKERDLEQNSLSMETNQNCSGVITKALEYLNKCLVLKETSQLSQSQQILKLLTQLLVQVRTPLLDKLLLTVIDSVEELVTKSCSQLTLPLMDVVLAANRFLFTFTARKPSTSGIWYLLLLVVCSVIPSTQPTVLESCCYPWTSLPASLCWMKTPQAPDCLPCPQRRIVSAVLSLLKLCCGDTSSSSAGCVGVFRFVTGSSKVQKCSMEALSALSKSPEVEILLPEVFKLLTEYLNSPSSDPSVLQKSYQALISWIGVCTDLSCITGLLREDLIQAVRKRACDMRWEARDSTVEFLGHLAEVQSCRTSAGEEREPSNSLLGGCSFTVPLLKEALQDLESYVRASSISALGQTLTFSWQQGAALTQDQVEIVTRLQEILSQDSEGFARRAVVKYFIAWFSSCSSPTSCSLLVQSVPTVLSQGVADLDWEVKLHTLELAELLLDQAFPNPAPPHPYAVMSDQSHRIHTQDKESELLSSLNSLVDRGVISALFCFLVDCDRPVALKACQLLLKLRHTVCPLMVSAADTRVPCELPGWSWVHEIRKIQGVNKDPHTQGGSHIGSEARGEAVEESTSAEGDIVCVSVCEVLRSLDLDERLSILTQSSDHIYNSPLSLLQDIITASTANSHPNSEPGQEVIVDCY
ncbi:hypothetical protein GOODEAATRI_007145 [Goodea atripinnis]|uniref:BRCA1-associated ATM activator 1 n=1 Tax=Goodea atripinnis TaxID=208336 RepID=A0ABV0PC50_9TELE